MYKQALTAGALLAALGVILGAFGAHSLKAMVPPERLMVFETGVRYQVYHSIALLLTGIIYMQYPVKQLRLAHTFFLIGIALFSGSLYAIVLTGIGGAGIGPLGVLTPIGGVFFILGWVWLAMGIFRGSKQEDK